MVWLSHSSTAQNQEVGLLQSRFLHEGTDLGIYRYEKNYKRFKVYELD